MEHFAGARDFIQSLEQRVAQLELESQEKDAQLAKLGYSAAPVVMRQAGDVPVQEIKLVLAKLNAKFTESEVQARAQQIADGVAAAAATAEGDEDELVRHKLRAVNDYVIELQREAFLAIGAEGGFEYLHSHHGGGGHGHSHGGHDDDEEEEDEEDEELEQLLDEFREHEERIVVVAALGKDTYERNKQEEAQLMQVQLEIEEVWDSGDVQRMQALVTEVRAASQAIFKTKLNGAKSQTEMMRLYEALDADERLAMMRAEVLQRIMGARQQQHQHGHSHNGQPCHGHGAQEERHDHGHSHNGQPCHGHGAQEQEERHDHGHSHNGQPCHGHGGHDEEDDESFDDEEEDDDDVPHAHSHSHGGQPCHGHGH